MHNIRGSRGGTTRLARPYEKLVHRKGSSATHSRTFMWLAVGLVVLGCDRLTAPSSSHTPLTPFPKAPGTFTFVTWNLWFKPKEQTARVAAAMQQLQALDVDFVALQEVLPEMLAVIEEHNTKYHIVGKLSYRYDTIILSKYPAEKVERIRFLGTNQGRNQLRGTFQVPTATGQKVLLDVVTFHLESEFTTAGTPIKQQQLASCLGQIRAGRPTVVMGDTNLLAGEAPVLPAGVADAFVAVGAPAACRYTYDGQQNPNVTHAEHQSRFDRIYFSEEQFSLQRLSLIGRAACVPVPGQTSIPPSDHYGVYGSLQLR